MEIFIARQPIFDRSDRVAAYEVLYRPLGGPGETPDADTVYRMSERVVVDAFLGIGLERVVDGRTAVIRASAAMLRRGTADLLDPGRVILQVRPDGDPVEETLDLYRATRDKGYRIALDGNGDLQRLRPYLDAVDVARLDVRGRQEAEVAETLGELRSAGLAVLADGVATRTQRRALLELGVELFQGYGHSRPETLARRDVAVDHVNILRLIKLVRDLDVTEAEIDRAFKRDVGTSYKLLRMVNSAATGGSGIQSILHAIRLLGRKALGRWLSLLLLVTVADEGVAMEVAQSALARGRLCELLSGPLGEEASADSLFLVGVFSLLDLLLGAPLEQALEHLNLAPAVREALLERRGRLGTVLDVVEAYEAGDWGQVAASAEELGLSDDTIAPLYLEALTWAREQMAAA